LKGEPLDARSDIFSFGVTLYEAVSGQRPFSSESTATTVSAILTEEPPPLSRYSAEVPDELQRVVRKCLEKDRDRRYQSAADLAVDLQNLRRHSETQAAMPASGGRAAARAVHARRRPVAIAAVLAIAAVAGGWYLVRRFQQESPPATTIASIAILPFVNSSGDQNTEYLSDGITESIINAFSHLPALRVMARATVFRYKGKDIDPQRAGRELGVDAVVAGRVLHQGDTLVIQADLVRVSDGSQLWGDRFNRKMADLLAVQDEISRQITERLRLRLTQNEQRLVEKHYTDNTEAYELYLKGRYFFVKTTEDGLDRSIAYFQQAVTADPNYALAYVGLAQSYSVLGGVFGFRSPRDTLPRSLEFAIKAVTLDPKLAEAHAALAGYKLNYAWDWAGAEQEIRLALDLNPNYSTAHVTYGSYYQSMGRLDAAIAERKLAQQLDPLSPFVTANAGYPYYYARRYDEALEHYRRAVDLDPNYPWTHLWIGQAYVQKGMYKEAIDAIDQAIRLSGGDIRAKATLGHAYGVADRQAEARAILDELKKRSAERYVSPYFLALVYAGLSDADRALASLEAAYQERHPYLTLLRVEPVFDRLRSDPRFLELQKRIGLTESAIR
jgi:TolB-like protein/Flp pilus assembly protein TadD